MFPGTWGCPWACNVCMSYIFLANNQLEKSSNAFQTRASERKHS